MFSSSLIGANWKADGSFGVAWLCKSVGVLLIENDKFLLFPEISAEETALLEPNFVESILP
jgi:hypothetical protein